MKYSKAIKKLRMSLGFSQVELAKKLNINQCTLSAYENATRKPSPNTLKKIMNLAQKNNIEMKIEWFWE